MNKNLYPVIGIIVLLLLGGGAYMAMSRNSTSTSVSTSSNTTATTAPSTGTNMKSLKDLFLSGIPQKCTFSDKTDTTSVDGITYISAGKMRGDINTTSNGKANTVHMIVDGKVSYMWLDDQATGFKTAFDPQNIDAKATQQQGVDINKSMNYNCSPGGVDNAMFTPPANVKFTDYSMMNAGTGVKTATPAAGSINPGCSACDSLSGDAQTQCRAALKCS